MLYGPIKNAHKIYVPVAVTDAYIAYTMWQEHNYMPSTKNHPFFNLSRIAT